MPLMDIQNLSVTYRLDGRSIYALQGVSLSITEGLSLGIVGESGSGKSTLAHALLRLLPNTAKVEGTALFDGEDLLRMDDNHLNSLRWSKMAAVFQKSMNALSPVHRIGRQLQDVYRLHKPETSAGDAKAHCVAILEKVGLTARVYQAYPHELSGGMMQRVSIALALLLSPKLLILDEATTALDVITQGQILSEIERLSAEFHLTRLVITHDVSIVRKNCAEIAVLYAGQLMEFGQTAAVLASPNHPYTKGLIDALPILDGPRTVPHGIPGALPDLSLQSSGCPFAPRCPVAFPVCVEKAPTLAHLSDGRRVACHLARSMKGENA